MKIVLKNSNVKKVTAVWTWKCNFATQQAWMSRLQRRKCRQNFQLEWKLIKLLSLLTCLQEGSDRNFFSSVKNSCFTLLTVKRLKRALHRSNRLSLTASLRTCAGMRRIIADNSRSIFAMPNGYVAYSKRFGNLTGLFARTWLVLFRADHVTDSSGVLRSSSWFWPSW